MPLLHLDVGALYNRFFGQTEENLRDALKTAEAMSPCVLWLDEIEKGLSAVSSNDDVSKRMLGTFLTWMAEKSARVFVVATANDVSALPPELLRKGRFDEVFFVDLPTEGERQKILDIHTHSPCNRILWNRVSSKTRAGMPCLGCTEPEFPFFDLAPGTVFKTQTAMGVPKDLPAGVNKKGYIKLTGAAKAAMPEWAEQDMFVV